MFLLKAWREFNLKIEKKKKRLKVPFKFIEENLQNVFEGKPLTIPLSKLNKEFKKEYRKETIFGCQRGYRNNPEVKVRLREYQLKYRKTPKYKAKIKAYNQKPEVKARLKEEYQLYKLNPKYKARIKAYNQKPEVKARLEIYHQKPKYQAYKKKYSKEYYQKNKAKIKVYNQRPEIKVRRIKYGKKYNAYRKTNTLR